MADNRIDLLRKIEDALTQMRGVDFSAEARALFAALGYRSERTLDGQSGSVDDFLRQFVALKPDTKSEREFRYASLSVRVLFQVTNEEVEEAARPRLPLFPTGEFNKGNSKSFLFMAVELNGKNHPRSRYASFTREINKRFSMPAVVLFRTIDGLLTLAFVHVRPNKRDPDRDVLGSVSLIREVKPAGPHRAHLDILAELSLECRLRWMDAHKKERNFDGLLGAWLDALDTEELNRRFYRDLFGWFNRAVKEAIFPTGGAKRLQPEEHVIRLITRLLFVWFIKEKGLVAEELFVEAQVTQLLKEYNRKNGDSYYRAVLQNLFFATLNTKIGQRSFSSRANATHRNFSRYRYREEMSDSDALVALFAKTPFINGGLFDCLDSEEAKGDGGYRIDYFSDNVIRKGTEEYERFSIPNRLFFDEDGLITLLNHYKFTVEENTPAEQEVALDPELLGKVFENLLAAYNPETQETARKQTGSYYTPRAVVDYMVDEALTVALAQKAQPADGDATFWEERLHYLLDYNDAGELFSETETEQLVRAIAGLRVLDPAAGSGAFPMGVLHKLTLALRRLDPNNGRWEALQKEMAGRRAAAAFDTVNQYERDAELAEISATFERYRGSDFGRKLYLIQNSIYGIDIQPVATQIAKLRFFISLAIEQQLDPKADNFGVRPLPNLETRFVAADALLRLGGLNQELTSNLTRDLQHQLKANRERHFHAAIRAQKSRYRMRDKELRQALSNSLTESGLNADQAAKVANWDPYDQNASAEWFDPEYMFGVEGFDVVIGNPPYVSHDRIPKVAKLELKGHYYAHQPFADLYCYFMERATTLLNAGGVSALITSNSFLRAEYGAPIRKFLRNNTTMLHVLNIETSQVFENVIVNVAITLASKTANAPSQLCIVASAPLDSNDIRSIIDNNSFMSPQSYFERPSWNLVQPDVLELQQKIAHAGRTLAQLGAKIRLGLATGSNEAFVIDAKQKDALSRKSQINDKIIRPILRGRDIERYKYTLPGLYILLTKNGIDVRRDYPDIYEHLNSFGDGIKNRGAKGEHWTNLRACAFLEDFKKEKIVWIELTDEGRFALCNEEVYLLNSAYFLLPPEGMNPRFLLGILNSNAIRFYLGQIAATSGMGTSRWINNYVKEFPIPDVTPDQQTSLARIVDEILTAKAADTSEQEAEIDRLVYELYGLTDEEISVVEDKG